MMRAAILAVAVASAPRPALASPASAPAPNSVMPDAAGEVSSEQHLAPAFWRSPRLFGSAFLGAGLRADVHVDGVASTDDDLDGGQGVSAGYEQPLLEWFALRGLLRYTQWNTGWADGVGYDRADLFDLDVAVRSRWYLQPRVAFTATVPLGLTLSHLATNVNRTGYTERPGFAAGYNAGILLGVEVLVRGSDVGLTFETGLRRHQVTHDYAYHATDGRPAPPPESIEFGLTWAVLEVGVTVPL